MRRFIEFLTALLIGVVVVSCSVSDEPESTGWNEPQSRSVEQGNTDEGRFDNTPFQWDYTISSDSSERCSGIALFPVKVDSTLSKISTFDTRPPIDGEHNYVADILVTDPNIVYVGAAYPESEFAGDFGKEILYPRNPIDVYTNFPDAYIDEITRETGSIGYKLFMKNVLRSEEYMNYLSTKGREGFEFSCSQYYSYSDIEKAFATNAGLGKIFSAKVKSNSNKTNIQSRLLGQLISKNFTVSMDLPTKSFFKDASYDQSADNPVFIRSITYGKIAILAIESEYSFEEVKKAIEASVTFNIFSAGGNYDSKDIEILQKSTITIYVISDNTDGNVNQYFSSIDEIKNAFKVSYSQYSPGLPIICKGYYTKDHSVFKIGIPVPTNPGGSNKGNGSNRGSGSRHPGAGSGTGGRH
ncbi:MAG: hypothetical protein HDR85_10470 [Bacteroides sp.]|nr:hypothetical protein [Bacteroides sp.]MDE5826074.1 thiol-activated cytolysin family protein [Duncaniella sp.]